mmetsp:Transcript_53004/g.124188  ORF Transcript_53004/g.124188 Transcript_53004/m.124188 type:complete len:262 (+) Transcript_53004:50-835(+)
MGCGGSKAKGQVADVSSTTGTKEPLPRCLVGRPYGKFISALPPLNEGRRDFARIFFANERKIFFLTKDMPSMRPLQASAGPSNANIGDLSEQVVERACSLFYDALTGSLAQAFNSAPDPVVVDKVHHKAMSAMSVNVGVDFALQMQLMPMFLQAVFVLLVFGDMQEARIATYGFVAADPKQVKGDRPESKRSPFYVRLLSPNLITAREEDAHRWEVSYVAQTASITTIMQAVEAEVRHLRDAVSAGSAASLMATTLGKPTE